MRHIERPAMATGSGKNLRQNITLNYRIGAKKLSANVFLITPKTLRHKAMPKILCIRRTSKMRHTLII
jgi:hypothetical protein